MRTFPLVVWLLLIAPLAEAATKGSIVRIKTRAGATVTGEVLSETSSGFLISNGGKTQHVLFTDIAAVDELTAAPVEPAPTPPPTPPAVAPAPSAVAAPAAPAERKFHYEKKSRLGLIIPGVSLFGVGWLVGVSYGAIVAATGGLTSNDRQYVGYFGGSYYAYLVPAVGPLIGELINVTHGYYSYTSGGQKAVDVVITLVSSVFQLGGIALAVLGFLGGKDVKVYDDEAARPNEDAGVRWSVAPMLAPQQVGLAASGTF